MQKLVDAILKSHALDDSALALSDDDASSLASDVGSPRLASVNSYSSFEEFGTLNPTAQSLSDVRSVSSSSSSEISSVSTEASAVPLSPWKVDTRLKDRSTALVNLEATYELPPDLLFDLLADPHQHARIFDSIQVW